MDNSQIRLLTQEAFNAVNAMTECLSIVDAEHDRLQHNFIALGETFKDQYYAEYQTGFEAGKKAVDNYKLEVAALSRAFLEYVKKMREIN